VLVCYYRKDVHLTMGEEELRASPHENYVSKGSGFIPLSPVI
jgi:hypothetical protein